MAVIRAGWKDEKGNVKKTAIAAAVLVVGLWWLINPNIELPKTGHVSPVQAAHVVNKSSPAPPVIPKSDTKAPPVVLSERVAPRLDPVVIPPPVDPWAASFGSYDGAVNLPGRGQCKLNFTLQGVPGKMSSYRGTSELACFDVMAIAEHHAKNAVMATTLALNPTRATFEGQEQDGALLFHATDNIIQSGTFKACEMASLSLRPFTDKKLSVKWQEKQSASGICGGGELILEKH